LVIGSASRPDQRAIPPTTPSRKQSQSVSAPEQQDDTEFQDTSGPEHQQHAHGAHKAGIHKTTGSGGTAVPRQLHGKGRAPTPAPRENTTAMAPNAAKTGSASKT
jgi:hypothetical protein